MSVEENKASVRRLSEEVVKKGNMSVVPELFAPNYVAHFPGMEFKGPEGFKQYMTTFRAAFPDYNETIEHMVAEGDMVAVFYTLRGTFKAEYMGTAPTGKQMTTTAVILARFEGGKQVEAWAYMDSLSFYQQLGIPIPTG